MHDRTRQVGAWRRAGGRRIIPRANRSPARQLVGIVFLASSCPPAPPCALDGAWRAELSALKLLSLQSCAASGPRWKSAGGVGAGWQQGAKTPPPIREGRVELGTPCPAGAAVRAPCTAGAARGPSTQHSGGSQGPEVVRTNRAESPACGQDGAGEKVPGPSPRLERSCFSGARMQSRPLAPLSSAATGTEVTASPARGRRALAIDPTALMSCPLCQPHPQLRV